MFLRHFEKKKIAFAAFWLDQKWRASTDLGTSCEESFFDEKIFQY